MRPYFAVQWHITDVCDQRCKHCYIFAEGHPALLSAPWSELLHTYAQIRALCGKLGRAPYIYLTGGDPILHPDFGGCSNCLKRTAPALHPNRAGRGAASSSGIKNADSLRENAAPPPARTEYFIRRQIMGKDYEISRPAAGGESGEKAKSKFCANG